MQNIFIIGRLGRDAVVRETADGSRFLSFTIAANSKVRGVEKTTWYDVISRNENHMGKLVEYLKKGSSLIVQGELDAALQDGNDGKTRIRLSVNASRIDFLPTNNSGSTSNGVVTESAPATRTTTRKAAATPTEEEEVAITRTAPKAVASVAAPATDDIGDLPEDEEELPF